MPGLAELLAPNFTVYTYDRRGRGESSNGKPASVQSEVEDIEALVQAAGGTAYLYGISSGACLAMEAALQLGKKTPKLAMYEPPYAADTSMRQQWMDYRKNLDKAISEGRPGDAVVLFMKLVGTPDDDRAAQVTATTLVMDGGANLQFMPFMHASASALAKAMPHGQNRTLEGQTHDVKAEVIAPVLVEFFQS
jgi:pimeloyl-ACP methyl ester carboxylesterase